MDKYVEQKGGDHYQMDYQHWDWCVDMDKVMGYLPCVATKYLERFHSKGTYILDLEKTISYLIKAELCGQWVNMSADQVLYEQHTERFLSQLPPLNKSLIKLVVDNKYKECIAACEDLISDAECDASSAYVNQD